VADPFVTYGQRAARVVARQLAVTPPAARPAVLRAMLEEIEPGLHRRTLTLAAELGGPQALSRAVAATLADGLARRVARLGAQPGYGSLGWSWNPLDIVHSVVGKVLSSSPAQAVAKTAGKGVDAIKKLGCAAVSNPLAPAAAAAYGGAAGGAGAQIAASYCAPAAVAYTPVAPPATPGWILPAAIAGGVVIIVLATR
jgi:hypothetical protein